MKKTNVYQEKEIKEKIKNSKEKYRKMDEIGLDQIAMTLTASGVDYEVRYAFHKCTGSMEIPQSKPNKGAKGGNEDH